MKRSTGNRLAFAAGYGTSIVAGEVGAHIIRAHNIYRLTDSRRGQMFGWLIGMGAKTVGANDIELEARHWGHHDPTTNIPKRRIREIPLVMREELLPSKRSALAGAQKGNRARLFKGDVSQDTVAIYDGDNKVVGLKRSTGPAGLLERIPGGRFIVPAAMIGAFTLMEKRKHPNESTSKALGRGLRTYAGFVMGVALVPAASMGPENVAGGTGDASGYNYPAAVGVGIPQLEAGHGWHHNDSQAYDENRFSVDAFLVRALRHMGVIERV